jgi:Rrf2 family transcriptional regulator, iron-sulfur cluster assembly transcription factor
MRLSTRAQYAVRAMVDLTCHSAGSPVSLREISEREEIPLSYLEQLFNRLKKGKIVESVRGPGGGYLLARPGALIRVGEIIATVEEPLAPVTCMGEGSACRKDSRCVTHDVWRGLGEKIREFLNSITLDDLVRETAARSVEGNAK